MNVIELRGPIRREHHHDMIENLQAKGLLKIIKLSELHKSMPKLHGNVKEFVLKQREDLRQQILALL